MGPGVPSVSDNVGIPEAPQILPLGSVMVQELGPELGPLLGCAEPHSRPKAGPTPSTNHTDIEIKYWKRAQLSEYAAEALDI